MAKRTCHGCEGKGWIAYVKSERIMPFFDTSNRQKEIVAGATVINREIDITTCILCHGEGTLSANTIADAVTA